MLEGKITRLRATELDDLKRDFTWINDPEVTRFLAARYPISHAEEERWLRGRPANDFSNGVFFAIETKDGVHIGNTNLMQVQPEDRRAAFGIMIGEKDYWSNGYGTDAIVTLLRFGFGEMNLHRVWLHTFDFNERAQACYRKCGFVEEGRLREHYYGMGRYWGVVVMGVLRAEFEKIHGLPEG